MAPEKTWTDQQRSLLDLVLDELIPASDDGQIPGAGALGVADFFPTATSYAMDPIGAVNIVLTGIAARNSNFAELNLTDRNATLKFVEVTESEAFATLVRLTYMGYYSRPDTRTFFGVSSNPVQPKGYDVERESDDLMQELTAPVRARGEFYRGN